jgi:hypothetical protein
MNGLYYYKLVSEYPEDVTKNCKLTINEIDSNFKTLKDNDIKTAEFVRGEDCKKADGTLVLTRNNGEKIIVPLDVSLCKNLAYDLEVAAEDCESGTTLTISYKDDEGEKSVTIENILTRDNIEDVIGSDILTKVITDSSLRGLGTMRSPLGIAGVEKTGMLAPAIKMLDLTEGGQLPEVTKPGTRFVTREYVNDYGYLYNGAGVEKIQQILDNQYERDEIYKEVEDREYYWHVPSKADWDALLDSIEPCNYRNHKSAQCHIELGKLAGKYLKSECGWINSLYECTCTGKRPYTGCSTDNTSASEDIDSDDYIFDNTDTIPSDKEISPVGIDKYGMTILPSGTAGFKKNTEKPYYNGFKETAAFWTTTVIAPDQDTYVKVFNDTMSGVYQVADCPDPYYSVRLVKKYDGNNYRETEYIDGVLYRCILFPESGQIWLASNFADKNGFLTLENYKTAGAKAPEVLDPNGGYLPNEKRIEMFINEYNGRYWEKKVMDEGVTIVIQHPCFDTASGDTVEFCWIDGDGYERCIEVEIPKVAQSNVEYRVYLTEDGCDKVLKNTDDLVVERVLSILVPMIDEERWEREKADVVLSGMIEDLRDDLDEEISARTAADEVLSGAIDTLREDLDNEIERAISAETELWEAIAEEASARTAADEELWEALSAETEARIAEDERLDQKIDDEIARATAREDEIEEELFEEIERATAREDEIDGQLIDWSQNPFTMSASTEDDYNMVLPSKDGIEEHSIKIKFDGSFGNI